MPLIYLRLLVVLVCVCASLALGPPTAAGPARGAGLAASILLGLAAGGAGVLIESRLRRLPFRQIAGGLTGLLTGALSASVLMRIFPAGAGFLPAAGAPLIYLALALAGCLIGSHKGDNFRPDRILAMLKSPRESQNQKILDTSVIIDGRIADICETGFLDGALVVPQFVLRELQFVADSSDPLKRNRGRKGLDILQRIKKNSDLEVQIEEMDFPDVREVDQKLIELARHLHAKIITNDLNLNKVAQLRGVEVLNINDLANSLKPVVLPGEVMKVFILKEGKEPNQGVAYLDDGTMVVVDNARKHISRTVDIVVTSVLQTTAGKMFFGRVASEADRTRRTVREAKEAGEDTPTPGSATDQAS